MLTRPTTDALLRGIATELAERVEPELQSDTSRVALQMIQQLLLSCAVRAAHEIAWMHQECDAIDAATSAMDDAAVVDARRTYAAAAGQRDLQLEAVVVRYQLAGEVLAAAVEAAYRGGDRDLIDRLRDLLQARSSHEMEIVGSLSLVGRG